MPKPGSVERRVVGAGRREQLRQGLVVDAGVLADVERGQMQAEDLHLAGERAQAFEAGSAKLVSVSQGGDLNAIKAQFGEVAKSCKSCHDMFRTK